MPSTGSERRNSVAQLYCYLAALVGLVLVVIGTTMGLFGAKDALLPELGLPAYAAESYLPRDAHGAPTAATEDERRAARDAAIADRRSAGINDLVNGAILAAVGLPTMVWHLRRGRRLAAPAPVG